MKQSNGNGNVHEHEATTTAGVPLEALRQEVAEGFMYAHTRENANTSKVLEVAAFSYALIELLAERGVVSVAELDERKKQVGQRLVEQFSGQGIGVALTDDDADKYAQASGVQIDCDERIALCRGACCRLKFALTVQDLEEGKVKWDLGHPYMIRHGADGYCFHNESATRHCGVYEHRPIVCRSYDCRKDKRIWTDFENRVINPELENIFPKHGACGGAATRVNDDGDAATPNTATSNETDGVAPDGVAPNGVAFVAPENGASRLYQLSRTTPPRATQSLT